jgi:hypothetical protein
MHWITEMMKWHPALLGALGTAALNCLVTSMPTPRENGSQFYQWAFNVGHAVVGALPRIISQYRDMTAPPVPVTKP